MLLSPMIRANLSNEMLLSLATKCRAPVRGAPLIRVHVPVYGFLRPLLIQFLRSLICPYHASVYMCIHIELWRNGDSKLLNEIASGMSNHPCKDLSCRKTDTISSHERIEGYQGFSRDLHVSTYFKMSLGRKAIFKKTFKHVFYLYNISYEYIKNK